MQLSTGSIAADGNAVHPQILAAWLAEQPVPLQQPAADAAVQVSPSSLDSCGVSEGLVNAVLAESQRHASW